VVALKLPLTVNIVIHRRQYLPCRRTRRHGARHGRVAGRDRARAILGWALKNRAALMPTRQQVEEAVGRIEPLAQTASRPHRHRRGRARLLRPLPQAVRRGWGRRSLNVTPAGRVLPCHAAESIPGLEFWSVKDHSLRDIWEHNPAFNALPQAPASCRSRARAASAATSIRRLPLPGLRTHRRRRATDRRLPPLAASPRGGGAGGDREDAAYVYRDYEPWFVVARSS